MKKYFFYLTLALSLALASCALENGSQYTPRLGVANFLCYNSGPADTLHATFVDNMYRVDTIAVGDTVRFVVLMDAITNNLVSFTFEADSNTLGYKLMVDSIVPALDLSSVVQDGLLYFKNGYCAAMFPIEYVARKAGAPKVTLTVESDSKFPKQSMSFVQPVE